ncbi:MAG: glycerophosphodiester phosphodiesterase family protein, partial [Planctomycetota bacterium]
MKTIVIAAVALLLVACARDDRTYRPESGPQIVANPEPPFVIAHRGASAYEPEHTRQAYLLGIEMGADFIEPDIVFTRDLVAICAHDITMEQTTNVADLFPDRHRDDGSWYWNDFTIAEIRTLTKSGRTRSGAERPGVTYHVLTLGEMLSVIQRKNTSRIRARQPRLGVIPELKKPGFYEANSPGFDPAAALVSELETHDSGPRELCIIQCFDLRTIEHLATLTDLPLVWLTGDVPTDEQLDRAAAVAHGLGPNRRLLEDDAGNPKPLIERARARGLALYPYTFKDEPEATERFFHDHGVAGLFTDN